jgi:hypothetical protein
MTTLAVVLLASITSVSCNRATTEAYVSSRNYELLLQTLREGDPMHRTALVPLREFLIDNKTRVYDEETEYLLDLALISLGLGDFLDAMVVFRNYTQLSGDMTQPAYQLAHVAVRAHAQTGRYLFKLAALAEAAKDGFALSLTDTQWVVSWLGDYYYSTMPAGSFRAGIDAGPAEAYAYSSYLERRETLRQRFLDERFVQGFYPTFFTDDQINEIIEAGLTDERLELVFDYLDEKRRFEEAAVLMREHGVGRNFQLEFPFRHTRTIFLEQALRVLFNAGEYDAVLALLDERGAVDEILTRDRTRASGYVWIAAAAIEIGAVTDGIEHALTAVRESIITLDEEQSATRPDLFATIYQIVFNDTFAALVDSPAFEPVAAAIRRKLADYRAQGVLSAAYGV